MENASKALIMAASVLLGVMLMSIGVALFTTFSDFSSDAAKKMQEKQISEWNNTYLKYDGTIFNEDTGKPEPIKVTAHDIVSVINSARQNNLYYFEEPKNFPTSPNENYYYVRVIVNNANNVNNAIKAETWADDEKLKFIKNNSLDTNNNPIYFKCTDVKVSSVTKRVYSITFSMIK